MVYLRCVHILVNMGECLANGSLQADSEVKFASWPMSWHLPTLIKVT